jgi:mRNA interferase RelE/StbE
MGCYHIEWKSSAVRELQRLERQIVEKVIGAVESLAANPFPPGTRKLRGSEQTYRVRVSDYRVIYEVCQSRLSIQIVRARRRKDVYRQR